MSRLAPAIGRSLTVAACALLVGCRTAGATTPRTSGAAPLTGAPAPAPADAQIFLRAWPAAFLIEERPEWALAMVLAVIEELCAARSMTDAVAPTLDRATFDAIWTAVDEGAGAEALLALADRLAVRLAAVGETAGRPEHPRVLELPYVLRHFATREGGGSPFQDRATTIVRFGVEALAHEFQPATPYGRAAPLEPAVFRVLGTLDDHAWRCSGRLRARSQAFAAPRPR